MRVLVVGKSGQLAWELQRTCPDSVELIALGRSEADIRDSAAMAEVIKRLQPACVINASAYTAVDKAESEPEEAYAVNSDGVLGLAQICKELGIRLVQVSTDFVFDGNKNTPYQPSDTPQPAGVYGASKRAGENHLREILPDSSVIVRTSWVYSSHGNNFVKTMLRLMAEKPELGVVYDQVGTPTWAKDLATWIWQVVAKPEVSGVYHWSDAGVASWYDFAVSIQNLALDNGILQAAIPIKPIPTSAYPLPAKRPAYSVLDKTTASFATGLEPRHWRDQLALMLKELVDP